MFFFFFFFFLLLSPLCSVPSQSDIEQQEQRLRKLRTPRSEQLQRLKEELEFLRFSTSQSSEHALRSSLLKTMQAAEHKKSRLQQYAAKLQADKVRLDASVVKAIAERNLLSQHIPVVERGTVPSSALKLLRAPVHVPTPPPPAATAAATSPSRSRRVTASAPSSSVSTPTAPSPVAPPPVPPPAGAGLQPRHLHHHPHHLAGALRSPSLSTSGASGATSAGASVLGPAAVTSPGTPSSAQDRARFASFLRLAGLGGSTMSLNLSSSASPSSAPASAPAAPTLQPPPSSASAVAGVGTTPAAGAGLNGYHAHHAHPVASPSGPGVSPAATTAATAATAASMSSLRVGIARSPAAGLSPLLVGDSPLLAHADGVAADDDDMDAELAEVEAPLRPVAGHVRTSALQGSFHGYRSPRQREKEAAARKARLDKYERVRRKPPVTYWEPSSTRSPVKNKVPEKFVPKAKRLQLQQQEEAAAAAEAAASASAASGSGGLKGMAALAKLRAAAKQVVQVSAFAKRAKRAGLDFRMVALLRQKLRAAAYTAGGKDFQKLFKHYDRDNSGTLEFDEFRSALRRDAKIAKKDVSDAQLRKVFRAVDEDGGGEIDVDEFIAWVEEDERGGGGEDEHPSPRGGLMAGTYSQRIKARIPLRARQAAAAAATLTVRSNGRKLAPEVMEAVKKKLVVAVERVGGLDYNKLFALYDHSGVGELDFEQFKTALRNEGCISRDVIANRELKALFNAVDEDGSGTVDKDEFSRFLDPEGFAMARTPSRRSLKSRGSRASNASSFRSAAASFASPHNGSRATIRRHASGQQSSSSVHGSGGARESAKMVGLRTQLRAAAFAAGGVNWGKMFRPYDRRDDKVLDAAEFVRALREDAGIAPEDVEDDDLQRIFAGVDSECGGTGTIPGAAFVTWIRRTAPSEQPREQPHAAAAAAAGGGGGGGGGGTSARTDAAGGGDAAASSRATERDSVSLDAAGLAHLLSGAHANAASAANSRRPRPQLTPLQQQSLRARVEQAISSVGGLDLRVALLGDGAGRSEPAAAADDGGGGGSGGGGGGRGAPPVLLPYQILRERLRDLRIRKTDVSKEDLEVAFSVVDTAGTGVVDVDAFLRWIAGEDVTTRTESVGTGAAGVGALDGVEAVSVSGGSSDSDDSGREDDAAAPTTTLRPAARAPPPRRRSSVMAMTQSQLARRAATLKSRNKAPLPTVMEASTATSPSALAKLRFAAKTVKSAARLKQRKAMKVDPAIVKKVKQKLRACSYTTGGMDFARLFKHYDRDNSGSLEFDEFRSALRRDAKIKPQDVSDRDLLTVFNAVDDDGGGEVEIDEFVEWLEADEVPQSPRAAPASPGGRSPRRRGSVMSMTQSQLRKTGGASVRSAREAQKAARLAALQAGM